MIRRFLLFSSLLALPLALAPFSFAQQKEVPLHRPPSEVAEDLASPDRLTASRALSDYYDVPEELRTRELRDALALSLKRENERTRQFYLSGERPSPEEYDYMYGFHLSGDVLALHDPAYVDELLPWLCCGALSSWIDMGREAISPVLAFVHAHEPGYEEAIHGGMALLEMMVDYWGLDAFSASEQEQLREIAHRYIANENDLGIWPFLAWAIRLASALEDAELIGMAQAIAEDESQFVRREITSEYRLRDFKNTVSEAVSGTREPYRHLTPEEDFKRVQELVEEMMEDLEEVAPSE